MIPTSDSTIRRRSDVRFRRVRSEFVVIRQHAAEVLVLNEWAGRVLELLDGSRTLHEVATLLSGEFETPLDVVEADVIAFATEVVDTGLGESVSEATP